METMTESIVQAGQESAGQRALFDYGSLDQETQIAIRLRTSEIKSLAKRMAADVVEIGGKLAEVKDHLGGNGRFTDWLSAELGWSERTAYNFIAVWQKFSAADFRLENIATSALYLLAAPSTPAEAVESAKQIAEEGGEVTNAVAKALVKEAKHARKAKQPALVEEPTEEEEPEEDASEEQGSTQKRPEPIPVPVSQATLDSMEAVNACQRIGSDLPVTLYYLDANPYVITGSTSSGEKGVFGVWGWPAVPEHEAQGVVKPEPTADETDLEAKSYIGELVNVGSQKQPEWWVIVGPEHEFTVPATGAQAEMIAPPPAKPAPPAPSKPKPGSSAKEIEAAWRQYGVSITIQLLPAKFADRTAMITVRAGDLEPLSKVRKESDVPFVGALLEVVEHYKGGLPALIAKAKAKPATKPPSKPAAKPAKATAKQTSKSVKQKPAKAKK